jgi:hypothetical protein
VLPSTDLHDHIHPITLGPTAVSSGVVSVALLRRTKRADDDARRVGASCSLYVVRPVTSHVPVADGGGQPLPQQPRRGLTT